MDAKVGGNRFGGRAKGTPNKLTRTLKEAILQALDEVGGVDYLVRVANEDPRTFCALVGKVLPMQVEGHNGDPIILMWAGEEDLIEHRKKLAAAGKVPLHQQNSRQAH